MGKIVSKNQPCLECESHDAMQVYDDGGAFCFSCQKTFAKHTMDGYKPKISIKVPSSGFSRLDSVADITEYRSRGFKERGITKEVAEYFKVKVSYLSDGETIAAHYYPYGDSYKKRQLPKSFSWVGEHVSSLFGKELFNGGGKRLIICEGEIDAMSVAQAYMRKYSKVYPVVALSSSVMASKSLLENREWIRSFKEVIIMFDQDEPGEKAAGIATKIIGIDKVKLTKLPCNDASDVLVNKGFLELIQCVWDAAAYVPSGIISGDALWKRLEDRTKIEAVPYPPCLAGINSKLKGKRFGEIALFISGTGSGKSTMLREDVLHNLATTDYKVGIISLEESPEETAEKLAGMQLKRNPAKEEIPLEELKEGFDEVFKDDRVILLDHQGAMGDTNIVDQLEYMALSGCRFLYIDHITMLVSEGVDNLVGNEAQDKVMNDLLKLVKRHPVWIGLVSHLRKAPSGGKSFEEGKLPSIDDIRGSGSIKQVSFDIISFARDMTADSDDARNTIKMQILKARTTSLTGTVPGAKYDYETGRLKFDAGCDEFSEL